MIKQASALAAHHTAFAPEIVALDDSADALFAFRPESTPPLRSRALARTGRSARGFRPLRIRYPRALGSAGMAMVGGVLSGLVIAAVAAGPHLVEAGSGEPTRERLVWAASNGEASVHLECTPLGTGRR